MRVNNIQIINNNNKLKQINFGEGKATLYSDFDRTFLPISHGGLKQIEKADNDPLLKSYFERMGNLFGKLKDDLTFKITTGRNFDEYHVMALMAKEKGFKMPLPDSLIVKNGGDEHPRLKNITDDKFYSGGIYPFEYKNINTEKKDAITKKTGWKGDAIKTKLIEIIKKHGFELREPGTTNSAQDYDYRSLFHDLYKNSTKENPYPNVIALRRDGDSKIHITFPKNITEFGKTVDDKYVSADAIIEKDIINALKEVGVKPNSYYYNFNKHGIESGKHPATEIIPSPNLDEKPITKLYDTQKAVEKAIKENDLVIVAGDSSNDKEMLNIGNYIKYDDSIKYLKENDSVFPERVFERGLKLKETLELKENKALVQKIKELPIVSIVVKNKDKKPPNIPSYYKELGKVIEVEEGKLDEGIKLAVQAHAKNNKKYAEKIGDSLAEVCEVAKKTVKKSNASPSQNIEGATKNTPKKGRAGWIIAGLAAIIGGTGALIYKKNKSAQEQSNYKLSTKN